MRKINLIFLSLVILLFNGCVMGSCYGTKESSELKELRSLVWELDYYAQKQYKKSAKSCSDFKNKVLSLKTLKDNFSGPIKIQVLDNKVKVFKELSILIVVLKNDIVELKEKELLLKENVDKYIRDCK